MEYSIYSIEEKLNFTPFKVYLLIRDYFLISSEYSSEGPVIKMYKKLIYVWREENTCISLVSTEYQRHQCASLNQD